jgi:lysophospholipase I
VDLLRRNEDEEGIMKSQEYFHGLIASEVQAGIPSDRIVVGGFSQGGAMSIFAGLTNKLPLAGIVGLSAWLLLSGKFKDLVPKDNPNKTTPVFMGHGDEDQVVKTILGENSYEMLKEMGFDVSWHLYE